MSRVGGWGAIQDYVLAAHIGLCDLMLALDDVLAINTKLPPGEEPLSVDIGQLEATIDETLVNISEARAIGLN